MDPTSRPAVPFNYALEQLARRWHVRPDQLGDVDPDWLLRGLEYMRIEASVKVTRG